MLEARAGAVMNAHELMSSHAGDDTAGGAGSVAFKHLQLLREEQPDWRGVCPAPPEGSALLTDDFIDYIALPPCPPGVNKPNYYANYLTQPEQLHHLQHVFEKRGISGIYAHHGAASQVALGLQHITNNYMSMMALHFHSLLPWVVKELAQPQYHEQPQRYEIAQTALQGTHRIIFNTQAEIDTFARIAEARLQGEGEIILPGGAAEVYERSHRVRLGYDPTEFPAVDEAERFNLRRTFFPHITEKGIIAYNTSRIAGYKGLELLIHAAHQLKQAQPDIDLNLFFAGGPLENNPDYTRIANLMVRLMVQDKVGVYFAGHVPKYLGHMIGDVHVVTSAKESGGQTVLEAGHYGNALIIPDLPTTAELAGVSSQVNIDGTGGTPLVFLRNHYDLKQQVASLAHALDVAVHDAEWRQKCGHHTAVQAAAHTWQATREDLRRVFT